MPSLVADIYDAGIETMFGLEIIRQAADHKLDTGLAEALDAASKEHSAVVLRCLPRLFESYVQSVKRHKGALFSQGSNQASGYLTEQVQRASMAFYATCDGLARSGADDVSWQTRVSLLEVVEKENLLSTKDEEAKALLRGDGDSAVEALAAARDGSYRHLPVLVEPHSMLSIRATCRTDRECCEGPGHIDTYRLRPNLNFLRRLVPETSIGKSTTSASLFWAHLVSFR